MSQVTHYFFEGATAYWVPRLSNPYADILKDTKRERKARGDGFCKKGVLPCPTEPGPGTSCARKERRLFSSNDFPR